MAKPVGIVTLADLEIMARTIYGEARSEDFQGMLCVAMVMVNRWKSPHYAESLAEVCQYPVHFSCWNSNDPNRAKLTEVTLGDPYFALAYRAAATVLAPTNELTWLHADHYVNPNVVSWDNASKWWVAEQNKIVFKHNRHWFYHLAEEV